MTNAFALAKEIEELVRKLSSLVKTDHHDGSVFNQKRLMCATNALNQGVIHYANISGMEPSEIEESLGVSRSLITNVLDEPFSFEMEVGSIVESKDPNGNPLHCGSGSYGAAVVVQLEPFIMVSMSGDMRWSTRKKDEQQVIGKATPSVLAIAMKRLEE